MICPRCGKETPNNSEKCVNCGVKFIRKSRKPEPDKPGISPQEKTERPPAPFSGDAGKTQIGKTGMPSTPPGADETNKTQISAGMEKSEPEIPQSNTDKSSAQPPPPTEEENELRTALAGRYEIIRKLGSGGMATVYLAREIALNREVAIKLLPRAFSRNADFVARFKNEAQVAANLEHPHIVRIYQISEEQELVFFVMSYIPGGSVTDRIKKLGTIPVDDVVKWGIDVCSALSYGHDHGVIHRDLKPDNLMLDKNDRIVVMDYGIARAGEGTGLTQEGTVIGTPQYMSPEQARGSKLDARSDIYSMGIVLYQMATGDLPFQATDAASLMYMHVHEIPEPPDARNADIPAWLRDIILKCLAKNPLDRFTSADELKAAISERYAPKLTVTPLAEKDRRQKIIRIALVAGAIVVISAIAGGYFRWQSGRQKLAEQQRIESQQQEEQLREQQEMATATERDDKAYEQALSVNTLESYNTYLVVYPEGLHVEEAKDNIAALEEQEADEREQQALADRESEAERKQRESGAAEEQRRREEEDRIRRDDTAYQSAEMANTVQAYSIYLQNYPNGKHVGEAQQKLSELDASEAARLKAEAEEIARKDDQAFQLAANENTKSSYNTYLISYPTGLHINEAKAKITAFEEKEAEAEKVRVVMSQLSIRLATIPGGSFVMGSENGGSDEKPTRTVSLSGFQMSSTEISQAQYISIMDDNPSYFKLDDNCPVERVTWKDALTFCNKLSENAGLEACYNLSTGSCDFSRNGFRLPTEAEWEYACRSESGLDYHSGDGESALNRAGWYERNSMEMTHPVGQKTSNAWGLYDMHGNVWEWCNDWYAENAYETGSAENPSGPSTGAEKVVRGGSWLDNPTNCRSAKRRSFDPEKNYSDIGFRVVRR